MLEHLEGDVVAKSLAMKEGLEEAYGKGSFYMSLDKWECQRRSLGVKLLYLKFNSCTYT